MECSMPEGLKEQKPRIDVYADVATNARMLIKNVLLPNGMQVVRPGHDKEKAQVLLVDITRMLGDPLEDLRHRRGSGDTTPAIVLAARFPPARMRDLFRLGVVDILHKPYRPKDLCEAIRRIINTHAEASPQANLQKRLDAAIDIARQRSEEIRRLSEIGRVVVGLHDLDQIMAQIVESSAFVTNAEEANIYLLDPGSQELILRASKQSGEGIAPLQKMRINTPLVKEVFETGQPVLRQAIKNDEQPLKIQTGFSVNSLIKVPIQISHKVVGILGAYNRESANPFTEYHLALLMTLADWTGVALEHAILRKQAHLYRSQSHPPPTVKMDEIPLQQVLISLNTILKHELGPLTDAQERELQTLQAELARFHTIPDEIRVNYPAEELVDLYSLMRAVCTTMQTGAEQRGLELHCSTEKTIPLFPGKREQIRRVLLILVSAALRRTTRGRIVMEVYYFSVKDNISDEFPLPENIAFPDGIWSVVSVADTSSGLSPEIVSTLRTPTGNLSAESYQAGFSIGEARMISESMGGGLWFDETEQGTTIFLAIPVSGLE